MSWRWGQTRMESKARIQWADSRTALRSAASAAPYRPDADRARSSANSFPPRQESRAGGQELLNGRARNCGNYNCGNCNGNGNGNSNSDYRCDYRYDYRYDYKYVQVRPQVQQQMLWGLRVPRHFAR